MIQPRIVIFQGASCYRVYDHWISTLAAAWESLSYNTCIVHLNDKATIAEQVYHAFTEPAAAYIGFNGMGIEFEEHYAAYSNRNTPFIGIYVDHPAHHHERLIVAGETLTSTFVTPEHIAYAKAIYPHGRYHLLPHGGSTVPSPAKERHYTMTFFGSYCPSETIANSWEQQRGSGTPTMEEMVALTDDGSDYLPLAAVGPEAVVYLDSFLRQQQREQLLVALDIGGVAVDLFGKGWEQLPRSRHRCHAPLSYPQALEVMAQSRQVLHLSPNFSNGSHERLLSAMINGALAVADQRSFFDKRLRDGETLITYSYDELEALPARLTALTTEEEVAIAVSGQQHVCSEHTWNQRAQDIVAIIA